MTTRWLVHREGRVASGYPPWIAVGAGAGGENDARICGRLSASAADVFS